MGILYLVATPLGNLEDMSPRALRTLREAALVAAEDTRHTGALLKHFAIETPLTSYYEHNKLQTLDYILGKLAAGDVALVSDAGSPAVNDPGYELVRAALDAGFDVRPVPGPTAPVAALTVSGLPTDSFLFLGYLPAKGGDRRKFIERSAAQTHTLIFLESPHRIADALADLLAVLGDRRICVAREMTKLYEEFWRGPLSGALAHFGAGPARGEFTLVVEGASRTQVRWTEEQVRDALANEMKEGRPAKEVSAALAGPSGWSKKEIYHLVHAHDRD